MTANELTTRRYQAFAEQVRRRDRYTCQVCGALGSRTVDHIRPRHLGGALMAMSNARVLCSTCNLIKGGSLMSDAEILAARNARGTVAVRSPLAAAGPNLFRPRARIR